MSRSSSPAPFGGLPRSQAHSTASTSTVKAIFKSGETFIDYGSPTLLSSDDSLSDTSILQYAASKKRHYSATLKPSVTTQMHQRRVLSNTTFNETRPIAGIATKRSVSEYTPRSSSPLLAATHRLHKASHQAKGYLQNSDNHARQEVNIVMANSQQESKVNDAHAHRIDWSISKDQDDHGPPNKRRRGMTSMLVDGALTAAVFTGAAAVTAVSLWSKWRRPEDSDHGKVNEPIDIGDTLQTSPPPPYCISSTPISRSILRPLSSNRSGNLHSRRHRATRDKNNALGLHSTQSTPAQTTFRSAPSHDSSLLSSELSLKAASDEDDDDETFARMQKQMEQLITDGKRALHSTPILKESEIQRQIMSDTSFSTPLRIPMDQASTYDLLRYH